MDENHTSKKKYRMKTKVHNCTNKKVRLENANKGRVSTLITWHSHSQKDISLVRQGHMVRDLDAPSCTSLFLLVIAHPTKQLPWLNHKSTIRKICPHIDICQNLWNQNNIIVL